MSYEQKYIKYKLKYFKLLLESKLEQKGGVLEFIDWPREAEKIKQGDILQIEKFGDNERLNKWNYPILLTQPIGEVLKSEQLGLQPSTKILILKDLKPRTKGENGKDVEPLNEYTFYASEYPRGVLFKKLNFDDKNLNITNENSNINNKNDIENLQEQIKQLENKQKELESKLENHYHILPTSGMKSFEQAHPYYNKKLD